MKLKFFAQKKTNWNIAQANESEDLSRIPVKYI